MKSFIKKINKKILFLLFSFLSNFNIGRYFLVFLNQIIFSQKLKIKIKDNKELVLFTPNRINHFRAKTLYTKEPETLNWIEKFEKDSIFFDIGANVGIYSCFAAIKNNLKVFAFEPSVFNLELLAKNINENKLNSSITIVPLALTNFSKISEFNMSTLDYGSALSTFGENYSHDGNKMKIKFSYKTLGISLDKICEVFKFPQPDYIKIDVDGLEHLILDGANNSIVNTKSFLIEVNEDFELQKNKIKNKLENLGFKLKQKKQSNIISKVYNQIWIR